MQLVQLPHISGKTEKNRVEMSAYEASRHAQA
jgi:hypothetical protein